jgi:hypothetical protein
MMDLNEMVSLFREFSGQPTEIQVSQRTILKHLKNGVNFIAEELELPKRTDTTTFALEAGVFEYALPSDMLQVKDVLWNGQPVRFVQIEEWRRDNVNYRGATPGTPEEVAVDGRLLTLYPPPSTDAITSDPKLTVRVLRSTFDVTPSGVPGFGDTDVLLAVYAGVQEFLSFKNLDGRYNLLLSQVEKLLNTRLISAKQRYQMMIAETNPGMSVKTGRTGPGR